MFTYCVDQVSKLEYEPDEDDRRWRVERGEVRPKKQSSPALLERHTAVPSRAESKPSTHFFGRTKKVSAPPSSQIEAVLAAAAHLREEERRRKRSASHNPPQNVQPHLLHPNYHPSTANPPHQKPHQQTAFHHPFSRSPLFQLYSPQQPSSQTSSQPQTCSQSSSQPQTRPNPPRKHSEGCRPTEKSKAGSKSEAIGAQLDAALDAVARRRRVAIGSKVPVASGRGGKAECG